MNLNGPVLGVWAHPDDEAWLSAGIMCDLVRRGQRVVCLTATHGELGTPDPEAFPPEKMKTIRRSEIKNCLEILGVLEHIFWEYPDGGMKDVSPSVPVADIVAVMEDVAPCAVLTFGPDGMTGHDDHKTISDWTTRAFREAGLVGHSELLYATKTPAFTETSATLARELGIMMSEEPMPETPVDDLALNFVLTAEMMELKKRALLAQESQVRPLFHAVGEELFQRFIEEEPFVSPFPLRD